MLFGHTNLSKLCRHRRLPSEIWSKGKVEAPGDSTLAFDRRRGAGAEAGVEAGGSTVDRRPSWRQGRGRGKELDGRLKFSRNFTPTVYCKFIRNLREIYTKIHQPLKFTQNLHRNLHKPLKFTRNLHQQWKITRNLRGDLHKPLNLL